MCVLLSGWSSCLTAGGGSIAPVLLSLSHWTFRQTRRDTRGYTRKWAYERVWRCVCARRGKVFATCRKSTTAALHTLAGPAQTLSPPAQVHSDERWRPSGGTQPSDITHIYNSCDAHTHTHILIWHSCCCITLVTRWCSALDRWLSAGIVRYGFSSVYHLSHLPPHCYTKAVADVHFCFYECRPKAS